MEKMGMCDFKKHLLTMPHDDLIADILSFYKDYPAIREYYLAKLSPDSESSLFEKYKRIIEDEFFPFKGPDYAKTRLSVVRQAINDFKKITQTPQNVVDLMFFYVSTGASYSRAYGGGGDIEYPAFYRSLETVYKKALQYSIKHNFDVKEKAEKLREECDGLGWSSAFSENIDEIYFDYLADIDDEG